MGKICIEVLPIFVVNSLPMSRHAAKCNFACHTQTGAPMLTHVLWCRLTMCLHGFSLLRHGSPWQGLQRARTVADLQQLCTGLAFCRHWGQHPRSQISLCSVWNKRKTSSVRQGVLEIPYGPLIVHFVISWGIGHTATNKKSFCRLYWWWSAIGWRISNLC